MIDNIGDQKCVMVDDYKLSPLRRQYSEIKKDHQHRILFFQVGGFYLTFDDDAKDVSKIFRNTGHSLSDYILISCVPVCDASKYIIRLVRTGKEVAICNQIGVANPSTNEFECKVVLVIAPRETLSECILKYTSNPALEKPFSQLAARLEKHRNRLSPSTYRYDLRTSNNE